MRVLFVTTTMPDAPTDGIKIVSYHLIRMLKQTFQVDIDLAVFPVEGENSNSTEIESYCRSVKVFPVPKQSKRQKVYNLMRFTPNQVLRHYTRKQKEMFDESIKDIQYDCIYIMPLEGWKYVESTKHSPKILNTLDSHSLRELRQGKTEPFTSYKKYYAWLNYIKMRRYERITYVKPDRCILVSEADKRYLEKQNTEGVFTVIQNGVDTRYFNPAAITAKKERRSIIFTGDYSYRPNELAALDLYEKIFVPLSKEYPDVFLYVVGKNPTPAMKKIIRNKNALVTGYVDDVRPYLKSAAVYVCPLSFGAGIRNKLLEALAMQLPIVCSSASIHGMEELKEMNLVKVVKQPCEYINEIEKHWKNNAHHLGKTRKGRRYVQEKYSWEAVAEQVNLLVKSNTK
jgi:glycosyltransferase involved in cell wall biosynthesis